MRRADDLNRHPCSPSLGARLADLRQEHWRHPNVRRGGPFQDRASWCGDFSASRIQDGNPFRARHEVGSGVLRFRPTLCWREMDSDFRFLVPVTRPSTVMGDGTAVSEKGSGFGAEPQGRIHLPPAMSLRTSGPSVGTLLDAEPAHGSQRSSVSARQFGALRTFTPGSAHAGVHPRNALEVRC